MITLHTIQPVHAELLSGMHTICFKDAWSPQAMGQILSMPGCGGWLAVDGDSLLPSGKPPGPAGFVLWRVAADEAEILTIAVLPPWRMQGLGHRLMQAACDSARDQGGRMMFLEVAEENIAGRALYKSCGMSKAGLRKGYYQGQNALIMRTAL